MTFSTNVGEYFELNNVSLYNILSTTFSWLALKLQARIIVNMITKSTKYPKYIVLLQRSINIPHLTLVTVIDEMCI